MSKKTFKNSINPAEFFISKPEEQTVQPAQAEETTTKKQSEGKTLVIEVHKPETKNVRVQLLITPSIKKKLQETADANGTSINAVCNYLFEKYF